MKPTKGQVFVEKSDSELSKNKFEVVDSSEAQWKVSAIADDVEKCRVGDYVLFTDFRQYRFNGQDIYIVSESDIKAVKTNSEMKK